MLLKINTLSQMLWVKYGPSKAPISRTTQPQAELLFAY